MNMPRRTSVRRGLGIFELLVVLAISAALLTAVGAAFSAAASAVEINDKMSRAVQASRVSVNLITTEIRRCQAVLSVGSTFVRVRTADNHDITWQYVPASGQDSGRLEMINNGTNATNVLAHDVADATFTSETGTNASNQSCISNVGLYIKISNSKSTVAITGAAAPRVNLPR